MGKKSKQFRARERRAAKRPNATELPAETVAAMVRHAQSGASGVHDDQKTRKTNAGGRTNRVGSRSSAKTAAIKDH